MNSELSISGFSYVRNGLRMGYPFLEAIQSVLPLCKEFIMVVGDSDDGTREAVEALGDARIKIVDTVWDMSRRNGGQVFADQVNAAMPLLSCPWALHVQADEVIHEADLPALMHEITQAHQDEGVDGLLMPFMHFWGSYKYIRATRRMHAAEVRAFKNKPHIYSYGDSQGFRQYSSLAAYEQGEKGQKLRVRKSAARIFHYNNVRSTQNQYQKIFEFNKMHSNVFSDSLAQYETFDYNQVDRLTRFEGAHPAVMQPRIQHFQDQFVYDPSKAYWQKYDRWLQPLEDFLGYRIGEYRNYKLLR